MPLFRLNREVEVECEAQASTAGRAASEAQLRAIAEGKLNRQPKTLAPWKKAGLFILALTLSGMYMGSEVEDRVDRNDAQPTTEALGRALDLPNNADMNSSTEVGMQVGGAVGALSGIGILALFQRRQSELQED